MKPKRKATKLLHYIEQESNNNKFVQGHATNGKICLKQSAVKEGLSLDENGKDPKTGNWMTIASPDDLFKLNIDTDFEKLNYDPFWYNINGNDSVMQPNSAIMQFQLCILKQ